MQVQTLIENIRFLEWRHAQETTNGLLASRASAVERYAYYLRLLGQTPDPTSVPATLAADRVELTEDNWDGTYQTLVGEYEQTIPTQAYGQLQLDQGSSAVGTIGRERHRPALSQCQRGLGAQYASAHAPRPADSRRR